MEQPLSTQEYVVAIPAKRRVRFDAIRALIIAMYPEAEESMKYRMPTFVQGEGWVALANQKQYISLYTCSAKHLDAFRLTHPQIKTGKGCINLRNRDDIATDASRPVIKSAIEHRH